MIVNGSKAIYRVSAKIPAVNIELAKAYIQGAIHSHCNCQPGEEFSVRSLFGGDNRDWSGTPLQVIYDYHLYIRQVNNPAEAAAKDVGWLFKQVLMDDSRKFRYVGTDTGNRYLLQ